MYEFGQHGEALDDFEQIDRPERIKSGVHRAYVREEACKVDYGHKWDIIIGFGFILMI